MTSQQNETASGNSNPNISVTSIKLMVLFLWLTTMSQNKQYFSNSSPQINKHFSDSSPQWKYTEPDNLLHSLYWMCRTDYYLENPRYLFTNKSK